MRAFDELRSLRKRPGDDTAYPATSQGPASGALPPSLNAPMARAAVLPDGYSFERQQQTAQSMPAGQLPPGHTFERPARRG